MNIIPSVKLLVKERKLVKSFCDISKAFDRVWHAYSQACIYWFIWFSHELGSWLSVWALTLTCFQPLKERRKKHRISIFYKKSNNISALSLYLYHTNLAVQQNTTLEVLTTSETFDVAYVFSLLLFFWNDIRLEPIHLWAKIRSVTS